MQLIIIFLILVLILLGGFRTSPFNELSLNDFKEYANELRSKGLYQQAIDAYRGFLNNGSISKNSRANIHYFVGEIFMENLKDFDKALAHFIKIKYIYPDTPLKESVNQKIIACLENSGRSREAQLALEASTSLKAEKKRKGERIIAKIDSDMITESDFNRWFDQLPQEIRRNYSSRESKKELLRQYVGQELMYRMAIRKGFQNDPEILNKSFEIKKSLIMQKLMQEELLDKIRIGQKEVETYYKANRDRYKKPLQDIISIVKQDIMQEKIAEKSQEMLSRMIRANSVQIFDDNLK
ncbi:MAG: hypothetical protein KKH98_15755 [Spirochaetes bacterium]|nr:hypothetical protein [Spirochaetota bacterium]